MNSRELLKMRIAFAWLAYSITMVAHAVMWCWQPGFIPSVENLDAFREHLLFIPMPSDGMYPPQVALVVIIMVLMALPAYLGWQTISLDDHKAYKLNFGFGIFFELFNFYHLTPSCADWWHGKLVIYFHIALTAALIWDAYKLKVPSAATKPAPKPAHEPIGTPAHST